ncbi:MAG TPA: CHASE2 domain-containing protein [Casimicrobiaceae bacterium]|nr:CHASE2 domain-containing protein [Casimicrobiaceae bacterium]
MTRTAAENPARPSYGRISAAGIALLALLAALIGAEPAWHRRLQSVWFDAYQMFMPREIVSTPVTVVEIDEKSVAKLGQWPWPRTTLAELVRAIERLAPAAIGIDILMPEPDRLSPERLLARARQRDPLLDERLRWLPSSDIELARAVAAGPVVVGFAGIAESSASVPPVPPFVVVDRGSPPRAPMVAPNVPTFAGALGNVAEIDYAAAGHGAISAAPSDDVIRKLPLAVRIDERLAPSLPIEMLRVALHAPEVRLFTHGGSVRAIGVGDFVAPTESDGGLRIYYSRRDPRRYVSAIDVLDGRIEPERLQRKLVLIGTSGFAMVDYQGTSLGDRMPGSEILAQALENLYDQTWLARPTWAAPAELALLLLLGLALIWATPRSRPPAAALLAVLAVVLPIALGAGAFVWRRLVFDAATPALGLVVLFSVLLLLTLAEAGRQRRQLERVIRTQREAAAYIAGEVRAAKRIQTGLLPRGDALAAERRVEIAAAMTPARDVGGDLYDFFTLDDGRLFFTIGDVAGKGLSASMFMAISKALYKSTVLRDPDADVGELMRRANADISRDNPEMFFVTAFAGVLDLDSGRLEYCNAGHDSPYVLRPEGADLARLGEAAGPPLCAVDGFNYRAAERRIDPGQLVCLVTDGVGDARNAQGERYGGARLQALLAGLPAKERTARAVVGAVSADVQRFADGAEAADDITLLVVRWIGPQARDRPEAQPRP